MILDAHHDQVLPQNTDVYNFTFWDGLDVKFRQIPLKLWFLPPDYDRKSAIIEPEVVN